ncbi:hypothetical protein [uncultured Ferrimonas sp.]|uniref:hypothetical protein n=1 Tax=uncultured Ferrimonas sp. TaxID=432640 RepID=UPI002611193E|nr:hypothetical protein [uncultured Ferrimonas sp.]
MSKRRLQHSHLGFAQTRNSIDWRRYFLQLPPQQSPLGRRAAITLTKKAAPIALASASCGHPAHHNSNTQARAPTATQ